MFPNEITKLLKNVQVHGFSNFKMFSDNSATSSDFHELSASSINFFPLQLNSDGTSPTNHC